MQTFGAFLVSLLAVSGFAAAVPAPAGVSKGSFSLPAVRSTSSAGNGPAALAKAYKKYGKPVPTDVAAAVERIAASLLDRRDNSTGSATNTPTSEDEEWLTPVSIGTPAQTLQLDFDTGSSDLWVFSTSTSGGAGGHTEYNPSKSSTSKKLSGATWSISYGDGSSSSGNVYTDVVTVGGLSVQAQAVETASKVSSEFESDQADGLLGLGFSSINTVQPTPQKTFFDNAMSSLDQPLFTADLKHDANGKYNFGYIDSSAYTGSIAYATVDNSQGFWMFDSTVSGSSVSGIADTGTTLLLLPDAVVDSYYKGVSGASYDNSQGGYTFKCSAKVPDFTFKVSGTTVTVPGDYINFAPIEEGSSTCFGGLQSDSGIGFSIFGDVALKAAFVVFNGGDLKLGWAAKDISS